MPDQQSNFERDINEIRERLSESKKTLQKTEMKAEELGASIHTVTQAYESVKRSRHMVMSTARNVEYLGAVEAAILVTHKCTPTYKETVFVQEKMDEGATVWEGQVEVFDVAGHERAKKCYAWQHVNPSGKVILLTVLGNQYIDSANKAVQMAIFMEVQPIKSMTNLNRLKNNLQIAEGLLNELQIKREDLDAAIQASEIRERLKQKRAMNQANKTKN